MQVYHYNFIVMHKDFDRNLKTRLACIEHKTNGNNRLLEVRYMNA